jgi:microcystin-dependent protein
MIQNNTIVNEDINASAAIAATKVQGTTPSGGSANQVLKKVDGTDYNTTWGTIAGAVYQASAPSSPQTGDVWVDSDAVAGVLNQNDYLTKNDFELFTTPIGGVTTYAGSASPSSKWAICDGTAVSRTTYDVLFTRIGTTYGVGNGTTTFNLPNLKGRVVVGVDVAQTEFDALGETGGAKTHTLTTAEMPSHQHTFSRANEGPFGGIIGSNGHGGTIQETLSTSATGGGGAHNNLQPYIALNYLIRIA